MAEKSTIIDENDEVDLVAEWADREVNSSMSPRRSEAAKHRLALRRRIEDLEERRRLKALLEDDYTHFHDQL